METFDRKNHWEQIYQTKQMNEFGWYQAVPETSLGFLRKFNIPLSAKIMDAGGGDGFFVDYLLERGYHNITVLDISESAVERVKMRLGDRAAKVKWIVEDIVNYKPDEKYDFWHDRAVFHFLTDPEEINTYIQIVRDGISQNGILVIGAFSEQGPRKCSGLDIVQYSQSSFDILLNKYFERIRCFTIDHITPYNKAQNYIFCSFRKL